MRDGWKETEGTIRETERRDGVKRDRGEETKVREQRIEM
jgi:hypothetical protein